MGPFKKGVVFHLELVVILAMWFYHQGALEAFTLTHGIKACCGGDQVLWRCLDTMSTQIRAHLSCTSPTPKCSGYRSTLPLTPAFHAACSKGELIKGPFKWLPFQSYYFTITKGEQIEISSLICCFPLLLIGVFVRVQQKSSPHFSCQSSGCNTGAHGCNFRLKALTHGPFSENRVKQVSLQTLWQITHATKNL